MAEGTTDSNGKFQLQGYTSEFTTIDPVLKVYHDCDDGIMVMEFFYIKNDNFQPCQRKVAFIIPDEYVSNGKKPEKIFNIGVINMQIIFEKEERDCLNRQACGNFIIRKFIKMFGKVLKFRGKWTF